MANGVSFVNVIVTDELKQAYKIALAQEQINMKTHIYQAIEDLIKKHKKKK